MKPTIEEVIADIKAKEKGLEFLEGLLAQGQKVQQVYVYTHDKTSADIVNKLQDDLNLAKEGLRLARNYTTDWRYPLEAGRVDDDFRDICKRLGVE